MDLHIDINELNMSELKGIAGKLNIRISGMNKERLTAFVVKELWYGREQRNMVTDRNYYNHLMRIINGMPRHDSWDELITATQESYNLIRDQIREHNLLRLREVRDFYQQLYRENLQQLMNILSLIRNNDGIEITRNNEGIERLFGLYITLEDLCQYIPVIRTFFRFEDHMLDTLMRVLEEEFQEDEDVVLKQDLNLTCEYVKDLEKISEEGCAICFSDTKCDTMLNCGHMFCIDCVVTTVEMAVNDHKRKLTCAMCRTDIKCIKSTDVIKIDNLAHLL